MLEALDPALARRIAVLEIHESLPSTNERLMQAPEALPDGRLAVCLAEHQSAGRGRNGKTWHSPAGGGLLLSVGAAAPKPPDGSLALALGVAIAEALESFVSDRVKLKWPNDLMTQDRKLGGILVETTPGERTLGGRTLGGRASRPPRRRDAFVPRVLGAETRIVVGLGVNIRVSDEQRDRIASENGLEPVGLSDLNPSQAPERNALAAAMIAAIAGVLNAHPERGFDRWAKAWNQRDWLAGKPIEAKCGAEVHAGVAAGVDASGALLLKQPGGKRRILSAEIRL